MRDEIERTSQGSRQVSDEVGFVVLPIPRADPTLGAGLAVGGVLFYRAMGSERPWITGAGGMWTENGSSAYGLFQKAYLLEDRLRVSAALASYDLNLDFFGIGSDAGNRGVSVPIEYEGNALFVKGLYEVGPKLYAGPLLRYASMQTRIKASQLPDVGVTLSDIELDIVTSGLGVSMEYDTRDSELNPGRGSFVTATAVYPRKDFGGDFDYGSLQLAWNRYAPMAPGKVLALRASSCSVTGRPPVFDLCTLGFGADLRGYVGGQYRDRAMFATQAELRWHIHGRWGAVAFGGVGAVAPSWGEFGDSDALPSAGVGVRFVASKAHNVNVALDWARGREDSAFYLRIGEAF